MADDYSDQEQVEFYKKISDYIGRHPEFVDDLQRKMDEEEKILNGKKNNSKRKSNNYNKDARNAGSGSETGSESKTSKQSIFKLDEEKINTIADELSGMVFDRDKSNKSVLEKTIQEAFSGMVKNYLSKYGG